MATPRADDFLRLLPHKRKSKVCVNRAGNGCRVKTLVMRYLVQGVKMKAIGYCYYF
jgi:hypothetical protein